MRFFRRKKNFSTKVGFVIAGTQKGGTTALDYYMRQHPDVLMPSVKNCPHFFDNEKNFKDKVINYSKYHSSYTGSSIKLAGDTTPRYMYWYSAPERIWNYNPAMKFIIILRNPIERAYSHWNMERSKGLEKLPFLEAISTEEFRCKAALPLQHKVFSYLDRGFYSEQLRRIWHYFPKNQVLIIKNEDLRNQLQNTLDEISDFLGVSEFGDIKPREIHSIPYKSRMKKTEFKYLENVFYHEIKELELILGWDCSQWLDINNCLNV